MTAPRPSTTTHLAAPLEKAASGTEQNAVVSTTPLLLHVQGSMVVYSQAKKDCNSDCEKGALQGR
jgi:hypothetical protein